MNQIKNTKTDDEKKQVIESCKYELTEKELEIVYGGNCDDDNVSDTDTDTDTDRDIDTARYRF